MFDVMVDGNFPLFLNSGRHQPSTIPNECPIIRIKFWSTRGASWGPRPRPSRRICCRSTRSFSRSKITGCACAIRPGGGGREVCASRAELIDIVLQHIFSAASASARNRNGLDRTPVSLVALGGYGRGELNPGSDVDVMFLHPHTGDEVPKSVAQTVEQVLYFLWDIGFKVGHSTRSVREAVAQANGEMLTKTAMLEARHLTGDAELFQRFRAQFRKHCVQGHEKEYIAARMEDQARRHEKFANNVYLQEPNVKRGCGGLRDYQNLLWITYFKEGALTTTHLVGKDWLSEADRRRIDLAYDFLLRVRTQLHYTNKRATDVLHLNLQPEVARQLGYLQTTPVGRSEAFMKDYYEHTRNIFRITERLTERFATGTATTTRRLFSRCCPGAGSAKSTSRISSAATDSCMSPIRSSSTGSRSS